MNHGLETILLGWLGQRGQGLPESLTLRLVDPLGNPVPRPEWLFMRDDAGWWMFAVDPLGRPAPRASWAALLGSEGGWGLYRVDALGDPERVPDRVWRPGNGGWELYETDPRGEREVRPLSAWKLDEGIAGDALYVVDDTGGMFRHATCVVLADPARRTVRIHEVDPLGAPRPRAWRVLVWGSTG